MAVGPGPKRKRPGSEAAAGLTEGETLPRVQMKMIALRSEKKLGGGESMKEIKKVSAEVEKHGDVEDNLQKAAVQISKFGSKEEVDGDLQHIVTTFKSSLFRLQVNELLEEVSVDNSKTAVIESTLHKLKALIEQIPSEEVVATRCGKYLRALGAPLGKCGLKFQPPSKVTVVGSFLLHTVAKPLENVDVAVEMPKACFHEKDHLNHKYHAKRALYLATIARHLAATKSFAKVEWGAFRGDVRKPILILKPTPDSEKQTSKFVIRIFPTLGPGTFDPSKLVPTRNNVRSAKTKDGELSATPHYNASILEDMGALDHLPWLHARCEAVPALREAIVLIKVWARQRGYTDSPDSLNGFLLSILAGHLSTAAGLNRIGSQMTSYQIFRVCMDFLANGKSLEKGIFLQEEEGAPRGLSAQGRQAMARSFEVVVCDPVGRLNLASRVTRSAVAEVKIDAAATLAALQDEKDDHFAAIFMTPVDHAAKFDQHIRVKFKAPPSKSEGAPSAAATVNSRAAADAPSVSPRCNNDVAWRAQETRVEALLARALGSRARLVKTRRRGVPDGWNLHRGFPALDEEAIQVGVLLEEPEVALRMVDRGPSADNKVEARKFRAFWGEKAELRRFKDGTISETAVWECPPMQRHLIVERICKHVLRRHLAESCGHVEVVAGQLDFALLLGGADPMAASWKLQQAFEKLGKVLRGLEGLPLAIVSVQALSAALFGTGVFPPLPSQGSNPRVHGSASSARESATEPVEVIIQLEGSGRWPDDAEAVRMTKLAFLLKIAESLQEQHGVAFSSTSNWVDLFWEGYSFRLSIAYEKDPTSLNSRTAGSTGSAGAHQVSPHQDAALRSVHGSTLHSLQSLHPLFSPVARLAKRWVGAHLLSGILSEEAVDLLAARLFTQPAPFSPPRSRITGFLRFLRQLYSHDWVTSPLIVDVNQDLMAEDCQAIQARFIEQRQQPGSRAASELLPVGFQGGPPMYLATPYDRESATWTRYGPTLEGLSRLQAYARSSAELLTDAINGLDSANWQSLFRTPLDVFDAVILLHPSGLPHPERILFSSYSALGLTPAGSPSESDPIKAGEGARGGVPLVGFRPDMCLLEELRDCVGTVASFWYDQLGGDVIGFHWQPGTVSSGPPKPSTAHYQLPASVLQAAKAGSKRKAGAKTSSLLFNTRAVVDDILALGDGLVDQVKVFREA